MRPANVQQTEKLLFRPREAAIALGVSLSWVYKRLGDGSLKGVRLAGRAVRIPKEELFEFAKGEEVQVRV
jgi:excisionase family DNA binding protein